MKKIINVPFVQIAFTTVLAITIISAVSVKAQSNQKMKNKILFVLTSHDKKGNTGEATGFYLSEVSHPWDILTKAGYEIDFVSPKGGNAPVDGLNLSDSINKKFWENPVYRNKIEHTLKPSDVDASNYIAIHYAGGHGAMWDFADNSSLAKIAAAIYENNGIISAVCHGPAGLVNIRLSDGKYLVDGKKINAFTNEEENAVKLEKVVPFLLESKLIERGAIFEKSGLWQEHVVTDERVVTGQNPQSAKAVGEAVLALLQQNNVFGKHTRFEVEEQQVESVKQLLEQYVHHSINADGNIMAEAFYEQNKPTTLWLIERWKNGNAYNNFHTNSSVQKTIDSIIGSLQRNPEEYIVNDLSPLSINEWRKNAAKKDSPIVIMLFVDTKSGAQQEFISTYKIALPKFRSEEGVITYQLSQAANNKELFITYEKFRNNDAFQYHLNFPPIQPVINFLNTSIKKQPFQTGLHTLIQFAPQNNNQ